MRCSPMCLWLPRGQPSRMWSIMLPALHPVTESSPHGGHRAGAGRAEAFLLNPQPMPARTAREWGVVAEVVRNGKALNRAAGIGRVVLEGSGGDASQHTGALHSTFERAHCAGSRLRTIARRSVCCRPCEVDESQNRTSGFESKRCMSTANSSGRRREFGTQPARELW